MRPLRSADVHALLEIAATSQAEQLHGRMGARSTPSEHRASPPKIIERKPHCVAGTRLLMAAVLLSLHSPLSGRRDSGADAASRRSEHAACRTGHPRPGTPRATTSWSRSLCPRCPERAVRSRASATATARRARGTWPIRPPEGRTVSRRASLRWHPGRAALLGHEDAELHNGGADPHVLIRPGLPQRPLL